jgi:predicted nucleic acid-binding protein
MRMKRLRLYLDTTVWNFAFADDAPGFMKATVDFFERVQLGDFDVFISSTVAAELADAPLQRQGQVQELLRASSPHRLEENEEVDRLAALYIEHGVLPAGSKADAFHLAYATYYGMDVLLSWNFRHLANMNRRAKVMAVNIGQGYNLPLQLTTPLEVLNEAD